MLAPQPCPSSPLPVFGVTFAPARPAGAARPAASPAVLAVELAPTSPSVPSPRHNTYLQECTGQREPTYQLNIHDIKLLFLRFAMEQSFSADTGGGGRESNIHLIPYIVHTVLYVLNTCVSPGGVCCGGNVGLCGVTQDEAVGASFSTEISAPSEGCVLGLACGQSGSREWRGQTVEASALA